MTSRSITAGLAVLVAVVVPAAGHAAPTPQLTTTPQVTTPGATTPSATPLTAPVASPHATPVVGTTPDSSTTPGEDRLFQAETAKEVLVRFKPGTSTTTRLSLIEQAGGTLDQMLSLDDTAVVDMRGSLSDALHWFALQSQIEWAEPNAMVQSAATLNYSQGDPFFTKQWALDNYGNDGRVFDADIDALASWYATKGDGATVGVVDTGVDASHPDLAGQLASAGVNFMPDGHATVADGSGHGTHVTGIIAALENDIGIVGAAPTSKVEPLRALDDTGAGTSATIASAFAYAGKQGLRIVNASLGASAPSKAVLDSIAAYPNTLYVVAAGNAGVNIDNGGGTNYPCAYDLPNILCVGASDDHDQPAAFSNRGTTSVDLSAPGVGIISTAPGNAYRYESGTSMATPFVSAVAAQIARLNPGWTAAQIRMQLIQTVDQPASLRGVSFTGGRVNAARAVGLFAGPDGQKPATVTGAVGTAGVGSATLIWQPAASIDLAVYSVESLKGSSWTVESIVETGTTVTMTGLTPGVPVSYRVRGIDRSGEEGDPSATVTIVPTAAGGEGSKTTADPKTTATTAKTATKAAAKGAGTATGEPAGTTSSTAVLSSVKRTRSKGKVRAVSFKLSAAGQVTVTAVPQSKRSAAQSVITKTFTLAAGTRAVKFGSGTPALRLKKGIWKITLATKSSKVALKVAIR
ncbi:MAG: S8 family serine peptidase [Solirubrobacteraceae bacterium]|nr:S8 family serine peptidase [Solirubrobacteraceae bacterium]